MTYELEQIVYMVEHTQYWFKSKLNSRIFFIKSSYLKGFLKWFNEIKYTYNQLMSNSSKHFLWNNEKISLLRAGRQINLLLSIHKNTVLSPFDSITSLRKPLIIFISLQWLSHSTHLHIYSSSCSLILTVF